MILKKISANGDCVVFSKQGWLTRNRNIFVGDFYKIREFLLQNIPEQEIQIIKLGIHEKKTLWLVLLRFEIEFIQLEWMSLRQILSNLPVKFESELMRAQGIAYWYLDHKYCPTCSSPLKFSDSVRMAKCENLKCKKEHFPKIDPAVIFLIENNTKNDSRILLGRQSIWDLNRYSIFAGFVESGESLEEAVRREAMEEVGLEVEKICYETSQHWPFPRSLMLGFRCESLSDQIILHDNEIEKAIWVNSAELDELCNSNQISLPPVNTISRGMINRWYMKVTGRHLLF